SDIAADVVPRLSTYTPEHNQRVVHFAFDRLMPEGFARSAVKQLVLNYPATLEVRPAVAQPLATE
ncbi:MAG: hypothetical protein ACO1RT_08885, partial [Planctomycetaceae bacterium]